MLEAISLGVFAFIDNQCTDLNNFVNMQERNRPTGQIWHKAYGREIVNDLNGAQNDIVRKNNNTESAVIFRIFLPIQKG